MAMDLYDLDNVDMPAGSGGGGGADAATETTLQLISGATELEDQAVAGGTRRLLLATKRADAPDTSAGLNGEAQDLIGDELGALWVHPSRSAVVLPAMATGLSAGPYEDLDQLGTEVELFTAAAVPGWGGVINSISVHDSEKRLVTAEAGLRIWITREQNDGAADALPFEHAALAWLVGMVEIAADEWVETAEDAVAHKNGLGIVYECLGLAANTSLWVHYQTLGPIATGWSDSSGLRTTFGILRD